MNAFTDLKNYNFELAISKEVFYYEIKLSTLRFASLSQVFLLKYQDYLNLVLVNLIVIQIFLKSFPVKIMKIIFLSVDIFKSPGLGLSETPPMNSGMSSMLT